MAFSSRQLSPAISGLSILILAASQVCAQSAPTRLRGTDPQSAPGAPAATPAAAAPAPASTGLVRSLRAPSLLQQPAREAQIVFAGDTLAIHADNSSLAAILRQFGTRSGMKIEGLGSDERVFGTFGPGKPSDVLSDLLNGTAYNLVLIGYLDNGAPRQLILTPSTHGGAGGAAAPATGPQGAADDASANSEPDAQEPQGPLDLPSPVEDTNPPPPAAATENPASGVKTPQQLFEQLQRMRQSQQNAPQDAQPAPQ